MFLPSVVHFKWFYSQTNVLLNVQIFLLVSVKSYEIAKATCIIIIIKKNIYV